MWKVVIPSFTPDRYTQNGLCYVSSLHIYFTVEPRVAVWFTDVEKFRCACYVSSNALVNRKPLKRKGRRVKAWRMVRVPNKTSSGSTREGVNFHAHSCVLSGRRKEWAVKRPLGSWAMCDAERDWESVEKINKDGGLRQCVRRSGRVGRSANAP